MYPRDRKQNFRFKELVTVLHTLLFTEVGSTAVQKYFGAVTRYFFSYVTGNVGTFSKKYRFWYRRYFFSTFTAVLSTLVWNEIKAIQKELKLRRSTFKSCPRNKELFTG